MEVPEHVAWLLNTAATLSGTCLAAAGILRLEQAQRQTVFIADNVAALSALGFFAAAALAYAAMRRPQRLLVIGAEIAFSLGLMLLAAVLLALIFEAVLV